MRLQEAKNRTGCLTLLMRPVTLWPGLTALVDCRLRRPRPSILIKVVIVAGVECRGKGASL